MIDRPLSATTSRISVTGRRDFGVKFITPPEEIFKSEANADSNEQAPAPDAVPHDMLRASEPPSYWDRYLEAGNAKQEAEEEDEEDCHPFWMGWLDMLQGMGLILAGAFKIPLVIGHGIAKTLHFIPSLYHDETVRKWPKITGFPSSCAASMQVLFFGLLDGLTDWFVLPYKFARKEGAKGFFKGLAMGFGSFVFKLSAAGIGLATHPFFGLYMEATKFKINIKRERARRPKEDVGSLI
ncbi:hypothetical protein F5Y05DRAFT_407684 [Hypoxylon sp. FL0543]|nr:hypothetical protein F5Y05DRAFT_407684 [Hypoxylon sp. FL0543]